MFKNVGRFENLFYLKKKIGEKNKKKSYDVHQYSKLEGVQKIYILSKKRRIVFVFDAKMATFRFLQVGRYNNCCRFGIIYGKLTENGP